MKKRVSKKKAIEKLTTDLDKMKMSIKQKEKRRRKNRKRTRKINKIRKTRKRRVKKHKKITKKGGGRGRHLRDSRLGFNERYGNAMRRRGRQSYAGHEGAQRGIDDYNADLLQTALNKTIHSQKDKEMSDFRKGTDNERRNNQTWLVGFVTEKIKNWNDERMQPMSVKQKEEYDRRMREDNHIYNWRHAATEHEIAQKSWNKQQRAKRRGYERRRRRNEQLVKKVRRELRNNAGQQEEDDDDDSDDDYDSDVWVADTDGFGG